MSDPFKDVMCQAKMIAKYTLPVEAHVTGTPVGEPPEYSQKGDIGPTEGASGDNALINTIMISGTTRR
ncbi:hypothetical protein N7471_006829 [Penicillium samsonianum]|uniref:uncharacterized protein n=1 Tax=Penicillium samsonianum TaxID=1882272 RepID=UPI00254715C3|nr:uncharacterized protein N7471_006829 [Penicillium samsonianum]KAJ6140343.1 hypothetical protein N7471_006829 [Penicillium samsonianum]